MLLTGHATITGVQLDVSPSSLTIPLVFFFSLFSRTGGVQVTTQRIRKVAEKGRKYSVDSLRINQSRSKKTLYQEKEHYEDKNKAGSELTLFYF